MGRPGSKKSFEDAETLSSDKSATVRQKLSVLIGIAKGKDEGLFAFLHN